MLNYKKKYWSHQTLAPGAESRPCRMMLLVFSSSSGLAHLLVLIVFRTVLAFFCPASVLSPLLLFACVGKKPPVNFRNKKCYK